MAGEGQSEHSGHQERGEQLELAVAAARQAGSALISGRRMGGPDVTATKSSPTDVVTAMDTAAERIILETIRASRPGDAVLAEEGGGADGHSGVRWVIDPIDGTVNYLYGLPEWAVSIGVEVEGDIEVGVVFNAPRDELFTAIRGQGAWLNGAPITCNHAPSLEQALVVTGFSYTAERRAYQAEVLRGVLPAVRDVRRPGSSSVDLCTVACGRADAYYERGLAPWDFAAGALIATEAGARVGDAYGRAASAQITLAAPPGLFDPLRELLLTLDPELTA